MEIKDSSRFEENSQESEVMISDRKKPSVKKYASIGLVGVFLLIFLGFLVFEFYHVVNNVDPSVSLDNDQIEQPDNKEENSFQRVKNFFSKIIVNKDENKKYSDSTDQEKDETVIIQQDIILNQETSSINKIPSTSETKIQTSKANTSSTRTSETKIQTSKANTLSKSVKTNNEKKYSLQLMAVREENFDKLKQVAEFLIQKDYYAYVYRTPNPIQTDSYSEGDYYYRLRIGFFDTKSDAVKMAHNILHQYPKVIKNYFVALPLKEEYDSDFFIISPETVEK